MQVKHRYIWIFGGLSVLYLLLMIVVGKFDLQTSDPEEQEEVYTIAREKEDSDLSYQISEREGENGTVHTESGGSSLYEGNHTTEPGKTMEPESTMVPESAVNPEIVMNPEGTMELESTMDPESTMNPEKTLNPESTSAPAAAESAESTLDSKTASAPQKETAKPKAAKKPLFYGYKNISKERQRVVKLAKKYVGKISYYWGGKPSGKEIQGKTDPHKLDCSGFIQFIYSKVKGKRVASVGATITISTLEKIRREALKPGDIGLKRGTGSLYFDADGKAYPEPGLAEVSNQRRVKNARKRIAVLEDKILTVNAALEEKQEKIREWKERKLSILKRARKLGKISMSESKNSFSIVEAMDEEAEETLERYEESYFNYGRRIAVCQKSLRVYREKRVKYREEMKKERAVVKKYDREIRRRIDHVGIYCGKDKKGNEIWCHCSSSGHGVVWENTDLFRYYYRYFKS